MADLTFDNTKVASHATSDGNTLTESAAGVVRKTLWQDVFGDSLDSAWTEGMLQGFGEAGTLNEAGGKGEGRVLRGKRVTRVYRLGGSDTDCFTEGEINGTESIHTRCSNGYCKSQ